MIADAADPSDKIVFYFSGNWNHYPPGYFELITPDKTYRSGGGQDTIEINASDLAAGQIAARMVSEDGTGSTYRNSMIEVTEIPPLGLGSRLEMTDDGYKIDAGLNMAKLMGGRIPIISAIPLLGNDESFGLKGDSFKFSGNLEDGWVWLTLGGGYGEEGSRGTTQKSRHVTKIKTVGYEFDASMSGRLAYAYNYGLNEWKFEYGDMTLMTGLYNSWTRGYKVPVVNIGVDATVKIGADLGGTFIVESDESGDKDYSSILYFSPSVGLIIGAGHDKFKVEGYGGGVIHGQIHVPTGYVSVTPSLYCGIRAVVLGAELKVLEESVSEYWNNGKDKVKIYGSNNFNLEDMNTKTIAAEFKPVSRDYINNASKTKSDYEIAVKEGENPQIALTYKYAGDNGGQGVAALFYDVEKGIWSDEIKLTEAERYARSLSPVYNSNGELQVAYTQAEVVTEIIEGNEYRNPDGEKKFAM